MKTVMERKTFRDMMKVVTLVYCNGDLFSSVAFLFHLQYSISTWEVKSISRLRGKNLCKISRILNLWSIFTWKLVLLLFLFFFFFNCIYWQSTIKYRMLFFVFFVSVETVRIGIILTFKEKWLLEFKMWRKWVGLMF